jgi:hypothetical protein
MLPPAATTIERAMDNPSPRCETGQMPGLSEPEAPGPDAPLARVL